MATLFQESFSLSHAAILNGATGAEDARGNLFAVDQASLDPDTDSYDNVGDDAVQSSWGWLNFATITVRSGYISFDAMALLTGDVITSSGSGSTQLFSIPLWSQKSFNVSPAPMLVRMPAKDSAGTVRNTDIVLYKVAFQPITFEGPAYKDGLKINYVGKCLMSTKNEAGVTLTAGPAVGAVVARG